LKQRNKELFKARRSSVSRVNQIESQALVIEKLSNENQDLRDTLQHKERQFVHKVEAQTQDKAYLEQRIRTYQVFANPLIFWMSQKIIKILDTKK